ncbi:MAG TPA: universal stress protein [Micropepsaceae bacterium]|nr:universal stress protein [Micropepsaceae bacterium]
MTMRYFLCPVSGTPADAPALATALKLARDAGGHVRALFVRPQVSAAIPYLGEGITSSAMAEIARQATIAADHALARARKAVADSGGDESILSLREDDGYFADQVAAAGRLADAVVFAVNQGGEPFPERSAVEEVLLHARRPLILAPRTAPATIGKRVAILWNNSLPAAHAVTAAMPFLEKAESIDIIHRSSDKDGAGETRELAEAFSIRKLKHQVRLIAAGSARDHDALADAVRAANADLVVMGGYAHSRIRELVFGGVTRHMLSLGDITVLMAH